MNNATELLAYELRRNHTTAGPATTDLARSGLLIARRKDRRHRLAERVRSVADRLDS